MSANKTSHIRMPNRVLKMPFSECIPAQPSPFWA
jgi:hypothetical protein